MWSRKSDVIGSCNLCYRAATPTHQQARNEFISLFNSIARHKHRYDVFRDFVTMSAIALHNGVCKVESLENEYLEIVGKYKREQVDHFCQLLALLVDLLEVEPADVLGQLYMELDLGNLNNGQFFTPPDISKMMVKLSYGDMVEQLKQKPFITVSEPACGAGGMILAFAGEMIAQKINPAEKMFAQCIDIDRLAGLMCYLQLSLWHVPAEVIIGNTLTLEFREVYYTPAYYIGGWDWRLKARDFLSAVSKLTTDTAEKPKAQAIQKNSEPSTAGIFQVIAEPEPVTPPAPVQEAPTGKEKTKTKPTKPENQSSLFDFVIDH